MGIKFHRFKVGGNEGDTFGHGTSWLVGLGILLVAGSLTIFSHIDTAVFFLIGFIPLLIIFYLSTNFPQLRVIILFISGTLGTLLGLVSFPDFVSTNSARSGVGLYHGLLCAYFIGIFISQKNSNKPLKQDK
jgi:hypothetical protein